MRRLIHTSGLVAAMENNKDTPEDDKKVGDNAESLETDLGEVKEAAAEGDQNQADTDEAEDTAAALEGFRVALEGYQSQGGISQEAAHFLTMQFTREAERVGITETSKLMPALESFGGSNSRMQAGQIALENLKETIQRVWKAIVEQIKKAASWIEGYWNKVFGAAEKLKKRATALADAGRNANGTIKETTWENDRLAKELAINNVPPTAILQNVKDLKEVLSAVVTRGAAITNTVGEEAVTAVSELNGENISKIAAACQPIIGTDVSDAEARGVAPAPAGMKLVVSKELFGGQALFSRVPSEGGSDITASTKVLGQTLYSVGKVSKNVKEPTSKKFATLKGPDAASIAELVGEIADELLAYRKNVPKLKDLQKKLGSAAEKVANSAGQEEDEGKRKQLAACQSIATASNRLFIQPGASFSKFALDKSKAVLDYIELSLKQYESK
jgi:hypothetical protein